MAQTFMCGKHGYQAIQCKQSSWDGRMGKPTLQTVRKALRIPNSRINGLMNTITITAGMIWHMSLSRACLAGAEIWVYMF